MNYREYLDLKTDSELSDMQRAYIVIYDIIKNQWSHLDNNIVLYEPSGYDVGNGATFNIIRLQFTISIENRLYRVMYAVSIPTILMAIDRKSYVEHIIKKCFHDAMDAYINDCKNVANIPSI